MKFVVTMKTRGKIKWHWVLFIATVFTAMNSCAQNNNKEKNMKTSAATKQAPPHSGETDTATLGNGCFWCTEAVFEELDGVISATSGYSGGHILNPTYEQVCTGETGHAECIQVVYDPGKLTYDELLEVFWQTHDPTTLNRQGADVGTQYRSVIFYHNDEQKQKAEKYLKELNKSGAYDKPVVTTIEPVTEFYSAENYHQEYYANNKNKNPYCAIVIKPKLEKFRKVFGEKLKKAPGTGP